MKIVKSCLNRQENEIIDALELAGNKGMNFNALNTAGISNRALQEYLPILEDKGLITRNKYGKQFIFTINHDNQPSYNETLELFNSDSNELNDVILTALDHAENWSLSEQMEVFQHVVNILTQTKYLKQFGSDIFKVEMIPDEIDNYFQNIDNLTKLANKKINLLLAPLVFIQLSNSIEESTKYLKNVSKRKRGRKSKIIKKIEEELKHNEKFKKQMKRLDKIFQKSSE